MILKPNCLENVLEEVKEGKKIVCFGAGGKGKRFLTEYEELQKYVIGFLDNDEKKSGTSVEVCGKLFPVLSYDAVLKQDIVIVITSNYRNEIFQQLQENSALHEVACYSFPFRKAAVSDTAQLYKSRIYDVCRMRYGRISKYQKRESSYVEDKLKELENGKFIIPNIGILLTSKCSLNCDQCLGLMPYLTNHADVTYEEFKENLELMLSGVDSCVHLGITGGEVLLHPRLADIINLCLSQEKIEEVVLSSNGTIMPSEEVLRALKNDRVMINVSSYQCVEKRTKIVEVLEKEGIHHTFNMEQIWRELGGGGEAA